MFLKEGFDRSSMEDVARAAGVSKATLYRYFRDKEDLFATLLSTYRVNVLEGSGVQIDPGADIIQKLNIIANIYLDNLLLPANLALFRVVVGGSLKFPAIGKLFFETNMRPTVVRLAEILQDHATRTGGRMENAELAATHFFGSLHASAVVPTVLGQLPPPSTPERALQIRYAVEALFVHIDQD